MKLKLYIILASSIFASTFSHAKSVDLSELQARYRARHFDEIELASGTTHYQSIGLGPTVVLVHGTNGPMAIWDKNVEVLVDAGFHVVRYDLYGRGFSSRLKDSSYDLEVYQRQLSELIGALRLSSPLSLVGNSLGAIIVTEYALHHRDQVNGVVLIGPAGFKINTPPGAWLQDIPILGSVFTYFLARRKILEQDDSYFVSGQMPPELEFYVEDQLDVPGTTNSILKTLKNSPLQSYVDSYRQFGQSALPLGLIWGREDKTFPYENSSTLLAVAPQAKLVTVENAGHCPQYERAEIVTPSLLDFLRSFL